MLAVACVLKKEEDSPYGVSDVHRLAAAVRRNLSMEHRFICLTDEPSESFETRLVNGIRPIGQYGLPGWWSKILLFDHEGPLLYFDLDTVIVGNLDKIAETVGASLHLLVLRNFYRPGVGSGILGWGEDISVADISADFCERCMKQPRFISGKPGPSLRVNGKRFRGDQEWLAKYLIRKNAPYEFFQDRSTEICSYKVDIRDKGLSEPPEGISVVCFHGYPRPYQVAEKEEWVKEHWEESFSRWTDDIVS